MVDGLASIPHTRLVSPGRYGASGEGVTITLVEGISIASIVSGKGQFHALQERCVSGCGVALPFRPIYAEGQDVAFLGAGPYRWLAVSEAPTLAERLQSLFGSCGAVCDQSDAYVLFDVSGPNTRDALAKGVGIDLDEQAFRPSDVATTSVALIGVTAWRLANGVFRFAVARSFAASFSRFLVASAAEFGCNVTHS